MRSLLLITCFFSLQLLAQDTLHYDQLISTNSGKYVKSKYFSQVTGSKQFLHLKKGKWLYYDSAGELIKEENFIVKKSKNKYLRHGRQVYLNPHSGDTILIRLYQQGKLKNQFAYESAIIKEEGSIIHVYRDFHSFSVEEYKIKSNRGPDFVTVWQSSLEDPGYIEQLKNYTAFEDSLGEASLLEESSFKTTDQFNYVNNPNFEKHPKAFFSTMSFTNQLPYWEEASKSPDLYIMKEHARSGSSFIGFRVFSMQKHIEYVQNQLKEPLKKDSIYCFSAYVKLSAASKYATNALGVQFTKNKNQIDVDELLQVRADISLDDQVLLFKTRWMKIQCTYKAKGGEQWMTIGSFKDHKSLLLLDVPGESMECYYYLDDVSLVPVEQADNCPCNFTSKQPEVVDYIEDPELEQLTNLSVGDRFVLEYINFENDKSDLLPSSFRSLNNVLVVLDRNPNMRIEISGHTSSAGSHEHNMKLSQRRAKAVRRFLVLQGISEDRVEIVGYGPDTPIADNDTPEGQRLNRRVEFKVLSN
ncbi:MAG: OmpA family protein [Bacteroidia bacterium]